MYTVKCLQTTGGEVTMEVCEFVLQDGLFEKELSASGNDGQLIVHVEAHQVADAQEHLILSAHLCAGTTHKKRRKKKN